jgi:hypothetical protein
LGEPGAGESCADEGLGRSGLAELTAEGLFDADLNNKKSKAAG